MIFSRKDEIKSRVFSNSPLTFADGVTLFREFDLHEVGELADEMRKRRHGANAYYVVNAHLNPTNICRIGCPLCAFAATVGDSRAYVMEIDDVLKRVQHAVEFGATQLHIVSSVHPDKPYSWYRNIISTVHDTFPELRIKAWTAVEIAAFAESSGKSVEEILADMKSCGLQSMPGGGAEIFDETVRKIIAPNKIPGERWLDIHETAHRLGITTNASMLFGHLETLEQRVAHLIALQELQYKTSGFDCFVPLVFHPKHTKIDVQPVASQDILKTIAISRLLLSNFKHIKAYWITLGESLAQIALSYGADDLDGTILEEKIHHDAGSQSPQCLTATNLKKLIREAGRIPVLR